MRTEANRSAPTPQEKVIKENSRSRPDATMDLKKFRGITLLMLHHRNLKF